MSAAVIHTWRANPLARLFATREQKQELDIVLRRVFASMAVVQLYSAPEHLCYELDEDGQWADDGGPCDAVRRVQDRRAAGEPGIHLVAERAASEAQPASAV